MRPGSYSTDPFTDLLFNALLGITFLFLIAIMFMNPIAKAGNVSLKAEYLITITWPDNRPDDVDIWMQDPHGEVLSYLNKDAGWLHLDRDDQGNITDTVIIEGREVVYPVNQEVVTIRGIIGGEYTLNLYYYENRSNLPVTEVNPSLELVYYDEVVLERVDVEKTVLRFTLSGDGKFQNINHNPKTLTNYNLEVRN
ncbi:MAG: hypothetical protein AMJ55_12520 [Gammaproteobacteria bacterium SG8_15]|nr:MAG: hypothetical protein AMJ55_12520 [Gammaproteobacteria bacterium SG8_15]